MAPRRPTSTLLPLEFPPDPAEAAPPPDAATPGTGGHRHAVQDDRPGVDPGRAGIARAAPVEPDAAADAGRLGGRAEGQPRALEGGDRPPAAGQRFEPDRQRGAGAGDGGTPGTFALRVGGGRGPAAVARRGDGLPPASHAARVAYDRARNGQTFLPF